MVRIPEASGKHVFQQPSRGIGMLPLESTSHRLLDKHPFALEEGSLSRQPDMVFHKMLVGDAIAIQEHDVISG
jgi:hypothetical protein